MCKDKFEETIDNFYHNAETIRVMPKQILIRSLEKLAYCKLFLEPDDTILKELQIGIMKFTESSEFQWVNEYNHYLATCFICNNISELCQDVLLENIFKPENSLVKFFVNEIAEQNKNGPLYAMWDKVLYSKLFPSAKENMISQENPSDYEISATIQKALYEIKVARPESSFSSVQDYLKLCKKYNRLDLVSYESILSSLLYKLVTDLKSTKTETSYEKLLMYSTFYQSLLLKTVFFKGQMELTDQEFLIISLVRDLVEEVKIKMDDIYLSSDKNMHWLERDGVYLAAFLKHLTKKIVFKYISVFNGLAYNGGFKLIYAERIYTYFIKPILNSTADEGIIPGIDQADFVNLFVSVTQYMYDTEQYGISHDSHYTRKTLFLTENEWKGLRIWLEHTEENGKSVILIRQAFEKYELDNEQTTKNNGHTMEVC